jgi:methionyl-tRNA formyltransferase
MKQNSELKIVFFGTGPLAESALTTFLDSGLPIQYVVTKPDSKVGRKQILTSPHIKNIAESFGIPVLQPASLKINTPAELTAEEFDVFIVASYGNIIPEAILDIPAFGTLNIHPSLLPLYRGPTPIETALYNQDKVLGVSIMFLDNEIDHGPILKQEIYYSFEEMKDATTTDFERLAGVYGASLLLDGLLNDYVTGAISVVEQDHSKATFTKKFNKETGLVRLQDDIEHIHAVYRACTPWPGCYFIHRHEEKDIRVKISEMKYSEGIPVITKVIPESKKEMSYESFKNGFIKK